MNTRTLDILRTILLAVTVTYCCALVPREQHIPMSALAPLAPFTLCEAAPDGNWKDAEMMSVNVVSDDPGPAIIQVLTYPCSVEIAGSNDAVRVKTVYDPAEYEWILQSIAFQNDII